MNLELESTPDILKEIAIRKGRRIVVGFAAETRDPLENARKKLQSKSLDAIVVNDVSKPGIGFDSERNAVTILTHSDSINVTETTKWKVAHRLRDVVETPLAVRSLKPQRTASLFAPPVASSSAMTPFSALWLPILLSAVIVFVASAIIHMVLPW